MNLHLYKVIALDDYSNEDDLSKTQVMTERDLREEFVRAWENGKIPTELKFDFINDPDYKKENWDDIGNLRIGTMVDIMNEIYNYTCGDGYYILETDIEVGIPRKMYELLGEIQSICIGADSPDALEHGERDPIEELQCCREDISAISNITEQLQLMIGE